MRRNPEEGSTAQDHDALSWLRIWRARTWRWWRLQVVAEASLWAAAAGLFALAVSHSGLVAALGGLVVGIWRTTGSATARDVRQMLQAVEASRPELQNALLAWHDIDAGVLAAPGAFQVRLGARARTLLDTAARPAARRPTDWWRAIAAVVVAGGMAWALPLMRATTSTEATRPAAQPDRPPRASPSVTATFVVTPPVYTGRPPVGIEDADIIEVLAGSVVRATYTGVPSGAIATFGGRTLTPSASDAGPVVSLEVRASGLLAMQDGAGTLLRTTAVHAVPDAAPQVRVTEPGRDLRVADAARTVGVTVTATDDIGLRSLRLLYTRVTGGGESFEFIDGELPLTVTRSGATSWQGRGTLDLTALEMEAGDTLVYHATARDGRLDAAGLAESERYLVEIPRSGGLAGGDFSLPEPENRYALSQRMVILQTERLLERRTRMDPDEYVREAHGVAVQQRRVRAEFVFLLGGHVVDEVEEAAHSHEIEAGRLENSGQDELLEAVRHMARAEQRLTDADPGAALPHEHRALHALQAAFGKARYFVRTLPTSVAIDVTRRGSGALDLAEASAWQRMPLPPDALGQARLALGQLSALTPEADVARVRALADDLVAVDRQTAAWLHAVQQLVDTFAGGEAASARRAALDTTAAALRARVVQATPTLVDLPGARGADEAALARAREPQR